MQTTTTKLVLLFVTLGACSSDQSLISSVEEQEYDVPSSSEQLEPTYEIKAAPGSFSGIAGGYGPGNEGEPDLDPDEEDPEEEVALFNGCWDDEGGCHINLISESNAMLIGDNDGDRAGFIVDMPGDVNNDGTGDILIGTSGAVKSYVFHGPIDYNTGMFDADETYTGSHKAVAGLGDVNGDGHPDVGFGHTFASSKSGAVHVATNWDGGAVTDVAGASHTGEYENAMAGVFLNDYADLTGDGKAEFIVGSYGDSGAIHVVNGSLTGDHNLADSSVFSVYGMADEDQGWIAESVGDLNDDGLPELAVTASGTDNRTGTVYIVDGSTTGAHNVTDVSLFTIEGSYENHIFGWSVAGGGDYNGDGVNDILIGAPGSNIGGLEAGAAYVLSGKDMSSLATFPGVTGSRMGFAVSFAGDINGDGKDDIVASAPEYGISGRIYTFFGGQYGLTNLVDAKITMYGQLEYELAGFSVASGKDVDGDGQVDILIGARDGDLGSPFGGMVYLVSTGNILNQ